MEECHQTESQTIMEHGLSVRDHMLKLISILKGDSKADGWRIPDWMFEHKDLILSKLPALGLIEDYTLYHDCGKPFCLQIDDEGKKHFPDHAEKSAEIYSRVSDDQDVIELIRNDMKMHTLTCEEIPEFARSKHACTLILSSLAEIHSNAKMFGGIDSVSFKIKWKHIDRRGRAIMKLIKEACPNN